MPTFDVTKWNTEGPTGAAGRSNCYNYALDMPATTDRGKKLQPGEQNNHTLRKPIECNDVIAGAEKDHLKRTDATTACATGCWKVALFIASPNIGNVPKDGDFHWYRQDDDGAWSHKMDGMDPSQVDNAGNPIRNPEQADTGPYTFCHYFCVCPAEVRQHVTVAMGMPIRRQPSVTGIFTSGLPNPVWRLGEGELADVMAMISFLPPTERHSVSRLGERGFMIDTGRHDIEVFGGLITVSAGARKHRYEDKDGLQRWLHNLTSGQKA